MTAGIRDRDQVRLAIFFIFFCVFTALTGTSTLVQAKQRNDNPVEVGDANWSRDYTGALAESRNTGKPLFLLFQEVPGCLGCRTVAARPSHG